MRRIIMATISGGFMYSLYLDVFRHDTAMWLAEDVLVPAMVWGFGGAVAIGGTIATIYLLVTGIMSIISR